MQYAGYAHLISQDSIAAIAPAISVELRPVTRKETIGETIAVPAKLAPVPGSLKSDRLLAVSGAFLCYCTFVQLPEAEEPRWQLKRSTIQRGTGLQWH